MLLVIISVLCSLGKIRTDELAAERRTTQTIEATDGEQAIKFTVRPNKDFFGRAVIVEAVPPSNYTGFLFGPYSSNERKFHRIFFNASGFWDNPGFRGSMQPFTLYNLTINDTESQPSSIEFWTDLGKPVGGVDLNFTTNGTNFVEVSMRPRFPETIYGPPTGYKVEACVAPDQTPCNSYVCLESDCRLDRLQPATNYSVKAFIFNVDSFNRTLEDRSYIKLYNVTTKEDPSANSVSPWIVIGGSFLGLCGLGGVGVAGFRIKKKISTESSGRTSAPTDEATELWLTHRCTEEPLS